ncbi:ABC transporter substrate-binding protein [Halomicrobium urmianum]|uniref:ABC transporter substrate-binding protein n=1 Tax=Halomicrobium urmianum TaxID=1586233 RepID=UPI001CD96F31|nr:ABC transporter substrate-binding protein [Halomicrobium urmianum]
MELTGASGAAALAGCSEDGGEGSGDADATDTESGSESTESDTDTDAGDEGPMEVHDATHVNFTDQVPSNVQFNRRNPTNRSSVAHYNLFDAFAKFNYARGTLEPYAIADWEFTGDTFEMAVHEGLTWDDGDPVTAEDVATQLRLGEIVSTPLWDYAESVETPDDRTVVVNLAGDVNPTIVEFDVLEDTYVHTKADVFEGFLDDDAQEQPASDYQNFAYQDVVASGPWSLEEANQQRFRMSRREDHPDAENVNFSEYVFRNIDGNQQVHQALINQDLDSAWSVFTPPSVVEQVPDDIEHVPDDIEHVTVPGKWGFGLIPNHDHEHTGDRAVRQAIQYVVDRKAVVRNVGEALKKVPPVPVGIPVDDQERWLGDAVDDFNTYGVDESMHDEAAAVLEAAGYAKDGGTWVDSDGNAVQLPVTVPSGWSDFVTMAETIVDQLTEFGFEASVDSRSYDAIASSVWPNGNFTLTGASWLPGGGRAAFAYFSLSHQLNQHNSGISFNYAPAGQGAGGSNASVTVPDVDGGETTVNPNALLEELSQSTDVERSQEIVTELAWLTNVDLPQIPVVEKLEQSFVGGENWETPDPDAEVNKIKWPSVWLPRTGELRYSGE